MADHQAEATSPPSGGNDDDCAAADASQLSNWSCFSDSSSSGSHAPPDDPRPVIGTAARDGDGDDAEHDGGDGGGGNRPLLFSEKSVRMGPFSIRYSDPSRPRAKPLSLYEDPSRSGLYHDFRQGSGDPTDDCDGREDEDLRPPRASVARSLARRLRSTRLLPLRILILAVYLACALSSFWILDSVKEPTLAILVDGELGKHQPRAKMVSFVAVVGMAVGMEWAGRARRLRAEEAARRRRARRRGGEEGGVDVDGANAALERSWADRDLPPSMRSDEEASGWRRMGVRTSERFWRHFHWGGRGESGDDEGDESSSKITTLAFYVVGSLYIHFFVVVAAALRQHPSFRPNNTIFHSADDTDAAKDANPQEETHGDWYFPALGYFFFVLVESYGSVAITIFWAFANSHLTLEAAERHYGSIVAVAQVGAIGGSTLSAMLGRRKEDGAIHDAEGRVDVSFAGGADGGNDARVTPLLIFCACGCIGCGMLVMALYARLFARPMAPSTGTAVDADAEDYVERRLPGEDLKPPTVQSNLGKRQSGSGGGDSRNDGSTFRDLFGGVDMIFRHEYLKLVLAVSVLYEIALTCMHYEMNLIGLDRFGVGISIVDESELSNGQEHLGNNNHQKNGSDEGITYIQFMGWYGQTVNVLSLFLSFYAFPRLIKHYGLAFTIRIFPTVLLVVTISAFVIFPRNLYFLFVSLSLCKALTYSVHDPSEEVLYMPTSDDAKFRAKFWIDVVGQRIAKAVGSAINNYAGSVEGIVKYGSLPSVVASLALWLACYQVGIVFDRLIKTGGVVGLKVDGDTRREEEGLELCEDIIAEEDENVCVDVKEDMGPSTSELASSKLETTLL